MRFLGKKYIVSEKILLFRRAQRKRYDYFQKKAEPKRSLCYFGDGEVENLKKRISIDLILIKLYIFRKKILLWN